LTLPAHLCLSNKGISEALVLIPADNLFLMVDVQVHKIITVPCHPDQQITVFFRVRLGAAEGLGIYYIKLDMVPVQFEIGPNEVRQFLKILFFL
jgi:hypothetical protein